MDDPEEYIECIDCAVSVVPEWATLPGIDQICLLQHRLPTLLRPMVVLALVLLVVGE